MKVLVVGATGRFASHVVPELKKKGVSIYALVRNKEKAILAKKNGADETVIGDLENEASLHAAAKGMDGVFHINPAFQNEVATGLSMVNAAKAAGIKKFVFSGVYHPSLSLANHADKRPVEEALYKSGIDYTILQPAMYMQTIPDLWKTAAALGIIAAPYSKNSKMSYVDYRDVAEVAAIAMAGTELSFGTFELSSPGMYSRVDLAALMSEALGKPVKADDIPVDEWLQKAPARGNERNGLVAMFEEYDRYGFSGGNDLVLKTILGREPRTVKGFIKELNIGL